MLISLTFDDGYMKHYEIAKMLYRRGIAATFFIIAGLTEYNGEKLLASRPELIKEIHDMGHEIASHTFTHKNLTMLPPEAVEYECAKSKTILEKIVGNEVRGFAYPYGAFNKDVVNIVKNYYCYARTMGKLNRWNESINPYEIGSMGIRHLSKLPLKLISGDLKLIVLTFHHENPSLVRGVVSILETFSFKITTIMDSLRGLCLACTTKY